MSSVRVSLLALIPVALATASSGIAQSPGQNPAGAPIEVAVTNVTSTKGRVHVDICTEKVFLTSDCIYFTTVPAVIGTTVVIIRDVPPGRYASQVFHDRNSNGHVDRTFGIPTEPVGFSNDAPVRMGPPSFSDAAFEHGSVPQRITLRLRSFL